MMPSLAGRSCRALLLLSTALELVPAGARAQVAADPSGMGRAPAIVISDPGTPVTALDPAGVNGVGQMTIDEGGGYVDVCTGTLVNPRTVVFAAHCVNEAAASKYGVGDDQTHIAFSFNGNNRAAQRRWITEGSTLHRTDTAGAIYTVNQVAYHADSLDLGLGANYLQADVAVASLDTPAKNIPTWTLLFSALPAPDSIDELTGTGYHVTITGYGHYGTGDTGQVGPLDFRRRVAENMIGMLGSDSDVDVGLTGTGSNLRQPLYTSTSTTRDAARQRPTRVITTCSRTWRSPRRG